MKITKEDLEQIKQQIISGETLESIAKQKGVSEQQLRANVMMAARPLNFQLPI